MGIRNTYLVFTAGSELLNPWHFLSDRHVFPGTSFVLHSKSLSTTPECTLQRGLVADGDWMPCD